MTGGTVDFRQSDSFQQSELDRHAQALAPDFKLLGELGRGGMGVVYLALDVNLDREVAIKVLPAHLAESPEVRERFLRESRTAAKLTHPNIVPVYRADEMRGVVFFVMRYVDGESLADRINSQGPLAPIDAARILQQVARALDFAHSRGVIHRDIKPENILLERGSDAAMVTDFGIARLMEAAPQTATGQVLGTVHYMSPEQILGEKVDGRSDVYSLGVVAFKTITGKLPFDAKTATAVLVEHVTKEAPTVDSALPGVPAKMTEIVGRCLGKDPLQRYQTAGDLGDALGEAIQSLPAAPPKADKELMPSEVSILSEREANALWMRAAELQAETGVQTGLRSKAPELGPPTARDRRTLTSGYLLSDVKVAASEVGIPPRYVDRARAELGLDRADPQRMGSRLQQRVEDGLVPGLSPRNAATKKNPWVGTSTAIIVEVEVPREVRGDDFELLLHLIQRALGEPGHVSILGRSFHWSSSHQQRRLQLSVVPRNGRTTIRADERLQPLLGGLFGGIVGGGGGGVGGGAMMPLTIALTHSPALGFGAFGATVVAAFFTARRIFQRTRQKRSRELEALVGEIADHIAERRLT